MKRVFLFCSLLVYFLLSKISFAETPMTKYLTEIPFLPKYVKPLLILDIDYSGSMTWSAYYQKDCSYWKGYYICSNVNYNSSENYYGYFNNTACYSYNATLKGWYKSNCDCSNPNFSEQSACVSGNLLNFLLTSRDDILLKSLIGGKAVCDAAKNYCIFPSVETERYVTAYINGKKYTFDFYLDRNLNSYFYVNGNYNYAFYANLITPYIPVNNRNGILQKVYDKIDLAVAVFNDPSNDGMGKIVFPYNANGELSLNDLVEQIQDIYPEGCTYTGESLLNIEKYLQQNSTNPIDWYGYINPFPCYNEGILVKRYLSVSNENLDYIQKASKYDPYYVLDESGNLVPVPCRKVYILVISDGEWNGYIDPKEIAYELHTYDLRSDLPGNQTATVYSLYIFSDSSIGKNAMSTIAYCGGYTEEDLNNNLNNPQFICNNSISSINIDSTSEATTFYEATDGYALEKALTTIINKILQASGSGVSIPTTKKAASYSGSGLSYSSYLMQSTFQQYYPANKTINWIGHSYIWWYWGNSNVTTIREDNIYPFTLNVYSKDTSGNVGDNILSWNFTNGQLEIKECQPDTNGLPSDNCQIYYSYSSLKPVVDLGEKLLYTSALTRKIYVNDGSGNLKLLTWEDIRPYVDNDTFAQELTKWIYGIDSNDLRIRTPSGIISPDGYGTWKLGDIVYASPLLVDYGNYTVAYIASNDGMLHAFQIGYVKKTFQELTPIKLQNSINNAGTDEIGRELWAFIPTNALPYLKYIANSTYGLYPNKHIYINDLSPYLVTFNGRLILIGGMRLGGAVGSNSTDAINPPDICKSIGGNCGLSEYYALDITNPEQPKLLWEFSAPGLGFTFSGPGIFKFNDNAYVVFGSGPINYQGIYQEQDNDTLKFYVLNLLTGKLVKEIDTSIKRAFAGRIFQEAKLIGNYEYLPIGYSTGYADKLDVLINLNNDESNPVKASLDNLDLTFYVYQPIIDTKDLFKDISNCYNYNDLVDDLNSKGCSWIINSGEVPYKYVYSCLQNWYIKTFFNRCYLNERWRGENLALYSKDNYSIKDAYALIFDINRSGSLNGTYLLTLYNSAGVKPPQVGGNPYIYTNDSPSPDEEYWETLYKSDFPLTVTVEKEGGDFTGGLIIISATEVNGNLDINWQKIDTLYDVNGTPIQIKPITSKVLLGTCGNKYFIFGGTGRWFFKTDNLETNEPFEQNFIFGIPIYCSGGNCQIANVEDVTNNINGTSNNLYGWYIKLKNYNATEELLREKNLSDPSLVGNTVLFATVQPSFAYCSISQGFTRFWAMSCSSGGAITSNQANGNIVTQLSTSQIVNIPLSKLVGKRVTQTPYAGIAAPSAPQLILPYQYITGKLLLWLEY